MRHSLPFVALLLTLATPAAEASWWERLFGSGPPEQQSSEDSTETTPTTGQLGSDTIADGLRAALDQGISHAVAELGREDGFWGNPAARVPLPPALAGPAELIRSAGGGAAVDGFRRSLNRAAEQAVPEAAEVFGQALQAMTLRDARNILQGADNAATQYFRTQTAEELRARFRPVVAQSIDRAGVGPAYEALLRNAGPYAALVGAPENLEGHVTERALDALFARIASEEARIRDEASARGNELLQRVFGG